MVLKFPFPVSFGLCWKLALMYFYQKPYRHYADVMSSFTGCLAAARLLWLGYHACPILSNISSTRRISSSTLFYIFSFAWFYEILALSSLFHTSYLSRTPRTCPCKFFLAGVNFYRFNAKKWHFRQILREKVAFFTDLTRKIGVFRCKFYSPKILPV